MKNMIYYLLVLSFCYSQTTFLGKDILSETSLYPIPEEMTFEEYKDMNRRLSVGLLLSAVPIPGMIHSYAGESKTAKKIRWAAAGGLLSIIGGGISNKEHDWQESKYETVDIGEIRYEKIPIGEDDSGIIYKYNQLEKEYTGGEGLFILGAGILFKSYIYDYILGFQSIEKKRDKARFKYGKMLNLSVNPTYDFNNKEAGIKLSYNF